MYSKAFMLRCFLATVKITKHKIHSISLYNEAKLNSKFFKNSFETGKV